MGYKDMVCLPKFTGLQQFAEEKRWVNYSASKIPVNPLTLYNGSSTNSKTWANLATALSNIGKTAHVTSGDEPILGVGIVLGNGLCGIDLDDVVSDDGTIEQFAQEIIDIVDSYTELSPSGRGIHILFTGQCPVTSRKVSVDGKSRELYTEKRFLTCTGNLIGEHGFIQERSAQVEEVYRRFYEPYGEKKEPKTAQIQPRKSAQNKVVEAIQNRDWQFVKEYLDEPLRQFDNGKDFFDFLYKYNLARFLGVAERSPFRCLFHEDNKPSASVFQTNEDKGGVWLYKCFSEELVLNIKELVKRLVGFRNDTDTLEFLKKCLNVETIDNVWALKQKGTIDKTVDFMISDDGFSAQCPVASKNLRWGKSLYLSVLYFAREHIACDTDSQIDDVVFYMSVNDLMRYAEKTNVNKVVQWLKIFQYHKMLFSLKDSDIDAKALSEANKLAKITGNTKRTSFFKIALLNPKEVEAQAIKWKENHYTVKGVSYEMFLRAEGKKVANYLYPQYIDTNLSDIATVSENANNRANNRHQIINDICLRLLSENGYFTITQLIKEFGLKGWGEIQAKRSLTDICNMYGIVRVKANNVLKKKYKIVSEGYPYIYIIEE